MIHIKFLMNEIKFKIYYSNVRMYKNMMQAFIEYIHNAKNDSQSNLKYRDKFFCLPSSTSTFATINQRTLM